jgi:transcriptional regulator with XRE-family HTH domain
MEFHEKLQELRKQKGLTQEALAEALYVSRTTISKWESGRGYPSIDSLKAMAKFFSVTIDALLTGEEALTIAEADHREQESRLRDLVFGLLDCSAIIFCFLPLFGREADGAVRVETLLSLDGAAPYLRMAYFVVVAGMVGMGILTLALQNSRRPLWVRCKSRLSPALNAAGLLLFIVSSQPYAAVFLFVLLIIKVSMAVKMP